MVHPLIIVKRYAKFDENAQNGSELETLVTLTFDLRMVHLPTIVNKFVKFDEDAQNGSVLCSQD